MNISLSDDLRSFILEQVEKGLYDSVSDYIRSLIREDRRRRELGRVPKKPLDVPRTFNEIIAELQENDEA